MHSCVARTFNSLISSCRWLIICWPLLGVGFVYAQSQHEATAQDTAHKRWAIIIGIDTYDHGFAELQYSDNDARNVHDALIKSGAYTEENVILMTSASDKLKRPTRPNILNQLAFLRRNVSKNDSVFFYFSGHGFNMNSRNYLVTSDSFQSLPSTALSENQILKLLSGIEVDRRFVVFDACRTQLMTGAKSMGSSWIDKKYKNTKGMFILYSTSEGQYSWQEDEVNEEKIQLSMFTHYLVEGLKGMGGIDGITGDTPDNVVSGGELLVYTSKKLLEYGKLKGKWQTPRKGGELSSGLFRVVPLLPPKVERSLARKNVPERGGIESRPTLIDKAPAYQTSQSTTPKLEQASERCVRLKKELRFGEAVTLCQELAEQGDPQAQYALAELYLKSVGGLQKDPKKIVNLLRKAADQGLDTAQEALGALYYEGKFVPKDLKEAEIWIRKAAEQGNMMAQVLLGAFYLRGLVVGKNLKEAGVWITKAAQQGQVSAQETLGDMYLSGKGVQQSLPDAYHWYNKAAEQGDADAIFNLGFFHANGFVVPKDPKRAAELYQQAGELFLEAGKRKKATDSLKKLKKLGPSFSSFANFLEEKL